MLDLSPKIQTMIQDILAEFAPQREVWAFGSRVKGTAKPYSDLDLVILGDTALPTRQFNLLIEAFEESELPIRVELVEWGALSPAFRETIRHQHEIIQSGEKNGTAPPF